MAMLNVRVPTDTEGELEAIAQARGSTKSDIAREAIAAYLSGHELMGGRSTSFLLRQGVTGTMRCSPA